jgi:hypothetical protein
VSTYGVAPATAAYCSLGLWVNTQTAGTVYWDEGQLFDLSNVIATAGTNLYSSAGAILSDVDVRNDQMVASALSFLNANSSFELSRVDVDGNTVPAAWFQAATSRASYVSQTDRDIVQFPSISARFVNSAIRVNAGTTYEVVFLARSVGTPANTFDVVVNELDTNLEAGKRAVGDTAVGGVESQIQSRTRFVNTSPSYQNMTLTTGWVVYAGTYTPTSTALWGSLMIGGETASQVEWAGIREMSTRNTGNLADLDTVGTDLIDPYAVTDVYSATDASETTSTLAYKLINIAIPASDTAYTAIAVGGCSAWVSNNVSGIHKILIGKGTGSFASGTVGVTRVPVGGATPGDRFQLQYEWEIPADTAYNFSLEYLGDSLGDEIEARDISLLVLVTKR